MFPRQNKEKRYSNQMFEAQGRVVYDSLDCCCALNRIWIAVVAQAVDLHLRWGKEGGAACRKLAKSYVPDVRAMLKLCVYLSTSNYLYNFFSSENLMISIYSSQQNFRFHGPSMRQKFLT